MRKYLLMMTIMLSTIACHTNAQNEKKETTKTKGDVIVMDNDMFIKNIFDYTQEKEWKYLGKKPVVIDFYADWCGPCRKIAPIIKELAKEYEDHIIVYKVNTDKEKKLAGAMGIRSLPTILFIPSEGPPQVIMGAAEKSTFQEAIETVLLNTKKETTQN